MLSILPGFKRHGVAQVVKRVERIALGSTMLLAFGCGFAHSLWPEAGISFDRLHVFLFNLCSGGTLILFYSGGSGKSSTRARAFFVLSLLYAACASMNWFVATLVLSLPLAILVESVRVARFGLLPWGFFSRSTSVAEKFEQASLLCLSLAIVIASLVIINNEYIGWLSYPKLTIDIFFLGYSFPISLVTMSLMFRFMRAGRVSTAAFWLVNLGVIVFFVFIIAGWYGGEIIASITLTITVATVFALFIARAPRVQQKAFLISGMSFLLLTAISGVLYILRYYFQAIEDMHSFLLVLHATISLYGWNLSGLLIIIRFGDFPIRLNSALFIGLHWIIVLVLSPLGEFSVIFSAAAVLGWAALLVFVFFSRAAVSGARQ